MAHNEHRYTDRCRCQRVVVIVIEDSYLCLSIPNFDNDYDHDNDKEIGGESAKFCDSDVGSDALN